jgi:NAD(P)-dependent dehydrogenase (short-subunit alcohol dehydrogenase family)
MAKQWDATDISDQKGRLIVITGATSGIGKETTRVLAGKNASVIIGARNLPKAEAVVAELRSEFPGSDVSVRQLDLSNLKSVAGFADSILADFEKLDVLINNAGIMMCPYSKTADGFEIQIGTNHLGHFALTGRLLPLLKKTAGSRVVVLSSLGHKAGNIDFSDLNWESRKYDATKAYFDSKLANLSFAYHLGRRLKDEGNNPIVTAAHPGWTGTDLQRHSGLFRFLNKLFAQGVEAGALPTLRAGFDQRAEQGDYFGPSRVFELHGSPVQVSSSDRSRDITAAGQLWNKSEQLTGVSFQLPAETASQGGH